MRRDADAHTPIVAFGASGSVGALPLAVRCVMGTWIASVWTLNDRRLLTPGAWGVGIRWRCWNGRSAARSNTEPRST